MIRRSLVPMLVLAAAISSACADAVPADGGISPGAGGIGHGAAASDLLLQIRYEGGFTPVDYQLTALPTFSLYGDGTILTPGPQIEIYPSPALPSIRSQMVTEAGIQAILEAAADAGLGQVRDMTDMGLIADASDTVFTLHTEDVDTTVRVYALAEMSQRPPHMSAEEFEARRSLQGLVDDLTNLRTWLPEGSLGSENAFEAIGSRIFVGEPRRDDGLKQSPIAWPLETSLASIGQGVGGGFRCFTVAGQDWETLLPEAQQANQLTPWVSAGERFSLAFRPLLSDETAC